MYIGQGIRNKNEIIVYMMISMLVDGFLDPKEIKSLFNITSLSLYRYMAFIKDMIFDFEFYYIDIYYDRKSKIYICKCNSDFKSKQSLY